MAKERMRIGLIQRDDTRNVLTSSGTLYFMTAALQRHVGEVIELGPDRTLTSKALIVLAKVVNKVSSRLFERRISPIHLKLLSRHAGRLFRARIRQSQCDVLYAPFSSVEIADLKTELPIVYHTDMTWADAVEYYSIYSSLFAFAKRSGDWIQRRALEKATATVVPTEWAANSIHRDYGIPERAISTVSYGANFLPQDLPSSEAALAQHDVATIRLLWIGVDWNRKGGPVALDCLNDLLARGLKATLTICGCIPPQPFYHPEVTVVPFLSKRDPEQRRTLSNLFLQSTFFIFPTQGEAAAIVLCEASAHGLPSLVPDTGGMSCVIRDGVNGYVLPDASPGTDYAARIVEVLENKAGYRQLLSTSRLEYEQRLNWDHWGISVQPVFAAAAQRQRI